jgi:hypothetical protein
VSGAENWRNRVEDAYGPSMRAPTGNKSSRTAVQRRVRSLLVAAGLLVAGCASGDGMAMKLRDATSGYNGSLRWGDIDRAAEYLPVEAQMVFMAKHDDVDDALVIVDYEVVRLDLDKSTGIAASRAEISWHTDRELIVRKTAVDQVWQFHDGKFVLVDERRRSGRPLTIFAEPEEDPHPYLPGLQAYREVHSIGEENKSRKGRRSRARRNASRGADSVAG